MLKYNILLSINTLLKQAMVGKKRLRLLWFKREIRWLFHRGKWDVKGFRLWPLATAFLFPQN